MVYSVSKSMTQLDVVVDVVVVARVVLVLVEDVVVGKVVMVVEVMTVLVDIVVVGMVVTVI